MEISDDWIRALTTTKPEGVVAESNVAERAWRIPYRK
jgi:hypothetical protein